MTRYYYTLWLGTVSLAIILHFVLPETQFHCGGILLLRCNTIISLMICSNRGYKVSRGYYSSWKQHALWRPSRNLMFICFQLLNIGLILLLLLLFNTRASRMHESSILSYHSIVLSRLRVKPYRMLQWILVYCFYNCPYVKGAMHVRHNEINTESHCLISSRYNSDFTF